MESSLDLPTSVYIGPAPSGEHYVYPAYHAQATNIYSQDSVYLALLTVGILTLCPGHNASVPFTASLPLDMTDHSGVPNAILSPFIRDPTKITSINYAVTGVCAAAAVCQTEPRRVIGLADHRLSALKAALSLLAVQATRPWTQTRMI